MAKATTADSTKTESKPAKTGKPGKAAPAEKPGVFARLAQYLRDVRAEMRRVVWPQRPEIVNSSVVVGVTIIFFAVFTFFLDAVVVQVLSFIRQIAGVG